MSVAPITIEPMLAKYNLQVSQLLVHGFRGKFQSLTNMNDDDLSLLFKQLFEHFPSEPASQRMVALQNGEVIGTISIKWKSEADMKQKRRIPSLKSFKKFGKWKLFKMLIGLNLLEYKPHARECYITDVSVHPDHRSKGVGKLLLQWAKNFARTNLQSDELSLHVVGSNPRAKHLYELISFKTQSEKKSFVRQLLFNESKWYYMASKLS
ncbi:GNAT family N-acetyltransferase [Lysinibacillus sp. NPDC048646]|uniref:GNAT family N-acetyltransferase n=1 Tax=Lysinibacillus sp. NPDC048646 TaxID=3390574 RepID=UPI003CFE2777